jgi:YbgC/YbaW family acyl-CoA thioester hydrolase
MSTPILKKNILIRFSDSDPQGIAYFNSVLQMAHDALEEFWSLRAEGWSYWFKNSEFAVPLKHVSCDFQQPLMVGETYELTLHVQEIGESSITFKTHIGRSGKSHAVACTVHVFVDKIRFQKIPVPEKIRAILA